MTTAEIFKFIHEAADWFIKVKAPELKEKADIVFTKIEEKNPLGENERKFFGFILFDFAMHEGPSSFLSAELSAEQIGVNAEFMNYAKEWLNYSKSKKNQS